jgi:hypothetical protein
VIEMEIFEKTEELQLEMYMEIYRLMEQGFTSGILDSENGIRTVWKKEDWDLNVRSFKL